MKQYTAAVIGCGRIGFSWEFERGRAKPATHIGAFLENPRIKLIGAAEIHPGRRRRAAKFLRRIPVYRDAAELFKNSRPDIVAVATPDETHEKLSVLAAQRGAKLVICEKPLAADMETARAIVGAAQRAGVILLVNHMRRFDPTLTKLRQAIRNGVFGRIQKVNTLYVNGLLNNGTHAVDLLRWYLGEVNQVSGWFNPGTSFTHRGDSNIDGFLDFNGGARVALQSLEARNYYLFEQEFYGTKAAILIRNLGLDIHIIPTTPQSRLGSFYQLDYKNIRRFKRESRRSFFASMTNHAVQCLDGKVKPVSTGEDGLKALGVLLALRRSASAGGKMIKV